MRIGKGTFGKGKERPKCRKVIERLLKEQYGTLDELLKYTYRLSEGLKTQAKKMKREEIERR